MQRLEVSCAVQHIYVVRLQRVEDTAQPAAFNRGWNRTIIIFFTQLLGLIRVHASTTGKDIFCEICYLFKGRGLKPNKLAYIVADRAVSV